MVIKLSDSIEAQNSSELPWTFFADYCAEVSFTLVGSMRQDSDSWRQEALDFPELLPIPDLHQFYYHMPPAAKMDGIKFLLVSFSSA